jgi:hypothetical protein
MMSEAEYILMVTPVGSYVSQTYRSGDRDKRTERVEMRISVYIFQAHFTEEVQKS